MREAGWHGKRDSTCPLDVEDIAVANNCETNRKMDVILVTGNFWLARLNTGTGKKWGVGWFEAETGVPNTDLAGTHSSQSSLSVKSNDQGCTGKFNGTEVMLVHSEFERSGGPGYLCRDARNIVYNPLR